MSLEDLTGTSKFIDALDELNPDGATDQKSEGDNHIKGIKNVLKNTFPNITAAITLTAANINNAIIKNVVGALTKQQYFAEATLTDAASIAWNLDDAQTAKVTLAGNRTLANPSNMKAGATYILRVIQDGTGSRTLAFGSAYKWSNGNVPTVSTTAGAVDILSFYSDGTNMYGTSLLNMS